MNRLINAIRRLGVEIPAEHREEFSLLVLERNLVRVRVVCWTLLVALVPYGIADYFTLSAIGTPESMQSAITLVCLRLAIVLFSIYYLFRLRLAGKPEFSIDGLQGSDAFFMFTYMAYMGFTLGYMYSFRTELSVYLLFILVASAFFVWSKRQSALILSTAFLSLAISLPLFGAEWNAYKYGLITLGVMTGISFVLAQLMRINQIQDFLNKKTIERQNVELIQERAQVEQARAVAVKANQAKSDFLASMSHEIRTPMNAILGMTEITLETELTDNQQRYLHTAHDSAMQLLAIINDILDFSKIEAGKMLVESIDFDLHGLMESAMRPFEPMAEDKGLKLVLDVDKGVPRWRNGDPVKLRQVLTNLLSNAVKFTSGGRVTLWAEVVETADDGTTVVKLSVIDTGVGVPEEKRKAIFDRFTQADSSITRTHGGTGLGLAISRRLAQLMDGSLELSPGTELGSVFTVTVPLKTPGASTADKELELDVQPGQHLRILVVDDSAVNLQVAGTQLEMLGHECILAESGQFALEAIASHAPDLVLMDVEMPKLNGFETTRIIRQGGPEGEWAEALRSIPVIAVTAHAVVDVREQAQAEGMIDFLAKPIRMEKLKETLAHFISARESR